MFLFVISLFLSLPFEAQAELSSLPPITVTATRTPESADSAYAAVTVLERADIDNSQAQTVPDLLRGLAGVDVSSNGGFGQNSGVFLRGTNSGHTLVLVDGIKMGSATTGTVAWQHLPISEIDRIEIVRGTRSGLYGSEAIGGVVQIFTRRGENSPNLHLDMGGGNNSTYQIHTGIAGGDQQTRFNISTGYLHSKGTNACTANLSAGCFTNEPDRDGYNNQASSIHINHLFNKAWNLELQGFQARGETNYDSAFQNQGDFDQQSLMIKTNIQVDPLWKATLQMGESRDKLESYGHNMPRNLFDTKHQQALWQNDFKLSDKEQLILGYELSEDHVEADTAYTRTSRFNKGLFGQYRTQYQDFDLQVSGRRDQNEQFGAHSTRQVALGFQAMDGLRTFISYGTAFKAPSFNDLYYPQFGNALLQPEEAENWELGFKAKEGQARWEASFYKTKIDKLISFAFDPASGAMRVENLNQADIQGAELMANWRTPKGLEMRLQYSWTKPEDRATGKMLPRRAEHSTQLDISEQLGKSRLALNVLNQSHRFDDIGNTVKLEGYTTLNLRNEYFLDKRWTLKLRLDNVLDKRYETAYLYPMAGRTWFLSVHYAK
ncbi:MAG: hypothetical protein RIT27_1463 [Pseudomonadota bacterium]|jgi:vitamin B12 transporter